MGMKSTGGEIVQVQGGHIVRSTGRKDRHSKVFTKKGPRDRRVRLSAHTAIQFYDVQDRLGYDRPSKAVDWLIKKAKFAIDKLDKLPPWNPTDITNTATPEEEQQNGGSGGLAIVEESYNFQLHRQLAENPEKDLGFIPPQIDTDAIAFFPASSATSSVDFHGYPTNMISRNTNSSEDLGLSLHFSQNPGLIHGQAQGNANETPSNDHQTLFSNPNPVDFEANYQRIVNWNNEPSTDINRGGFLLNSPLLLGQGSILSQRGTLQSSFPPSVRVWNDIPISTSEHQKSESAQQASIFGSRFLSDGFAGFCFPPRIQGEAENHGVASDRPSSGSANSHR